MTIQEKTDDIFLTIENLVQESLHTCTIIKKTMKMVDLSRRDINIIIMFLTGQSLMEYINERKMMRILQRLLNEHVFSCSNLAHEAGFDNEKSFVRSFKKTFHITPQDAFNRHCVDLYKPVPTWVTTSENKYHTPRQTQAPDIYDHEVDDFAESYKLRKLFDDAAELHNLPVEYTNIVYEIITKRDIKKEFFDMIFNYISEWLERSFDEIPDNSTAEQRYNFVKQNAERKEMLYLYLQIGVSVDLSLTLLEKIPEGIHLSGLPSDFVEGFAHLPNMQYNEYEKAYEYFTTFIKQNPAINDIYGAFQKYIALLIKRMTKEQAIKVISAERALYEKYTDRLIDSYN